MGYLNDKGGYIKSNSEIAWEILFSVVVFGGLVQFWNNVIDEGKNFSWFALIATPLAIWFAWEVLKSAIGALRCRENINHRAR